MSKLLVLAAFAAFGGCASVHPHAHVEVAPASFEQLIAIPADDGPAPTKLAIDVRSVDSLAEGEALTGDNSSGQQVSLRPKECQCRAAASSAKANLIELERSVPSHSSTCGCKHGAGGHALRDSMLKLRARDERNKAAGEALDVFYQLAEAEANRELLNDSVALAQSAIDSLEQLKAEGLAIDADEAALHRRKDELLQQHAELESSLIQLNGQLHVLVGSDAAGVAPFQPLANLRVQVEPLDADEQIAIGMASRADLAMLDLLNHRLNVDTLPAARSTLQQEDSSLGLPSLSQPLAHIMHGEPDAQEMVVRRQQLQYLHAERTRTAVIEIRTAADSIHGGLRNVALAKTTLASRQQRLSDVEEQQDAGRATEFDVVTAKLSINEAQSDLIRAVIAWKKAQVQLRRSQGLLAIECGFAH